MLRKLTLTVVVIFLLAVATGQAAQVYKVTSANYAFWKYKVHPAENPNWSQHGTYEGGLGIWYGNWDVWSAHFGLTNKFPSAGDAPPDTQILVADWAYHNWRDNRGNRPYWGSFSRVGRPS